MIGSGFKKVCTLFGDGDRGVALLVFLPKYVILSIKNVLEVATVSYCLVTPPKHFLLVVLRKPLYHHPFVLKQNVYVRQHLYC